LGSFGTTSCTAISAPRYFLKTLTFKRNPIVTDTTPRLALPLLAAAQAQKHVTHNEALVRLDQILHLSVKSRLAPMPPGDPAENEKHIVADAAGGAFAGQSGKIACFTSGAWDFIAPSDGWLAWVEDDAALVAYHAGAWVSAGTAAALSTLGINASADMTNRLAVSSPATLLNHAGTDHRLKINKAAAENTASVVLQDGFSGRAEFGLSGDDRFSIKVSPDGINWTEALSIDNDTGVVSLPATGAPGGGAEAVAVGENLLINGGFALNQRAFAGGSLAAGSYGFDRWKAGAAGANLSRSGDTLTLASGSIIQVVEPAIFGFGDIANETLTISLDHVSGAAVTLSVFGENRIIDTAGGRSSAQLSGSRRAWRHGRGHARGDVRRGRRGEDQDGDRASPDPLSGPPPAARGNACAQILQAHRGAYRPFPLCPGLRKLLFQQPSNTPSPCAPYPPSHVSLALTETFSETIRRKP
jgi:hypothetical protein